MLDFNHRETLSEKLTVLIDEGLAASREPPRRYLGASMLGGPCVRALQFQYALTPKDEGKDFSGRTLRIFQAGHVFEDLAIGWLRRAGFDLVTRNKACRQLGFESLNGEIKGHVDGVIVGAPPELGFACPMLWECKSMNHKIWTDTAKRGVALAEPAYAAQIALYQAYMEAAIPGLSDNPCLFTAVNKDTAKIYFELVPFDRALAQETSDKAVRIVKATEHHELLPRCASTPAFYTCRICPWADRCWREPA